ncbi:MAG: hypothetical protein Q4P07_03850 [Ornithinimicrobium sp.]|uniref:hypothetical protein n=1 Tax=Ornithinimicrobium sp. TaxID=1977084 RepID=UPI0026DECFBB|nr:hypothetical protein [Ornithinimicrobium sp.]MDO5739262.1 hypothetical protein [Ornithinimicrobium sp.]
MSDLTPPEDTIVEQEQEQAQEWRTAPGWWRRNRWALIAMPLVLALVLALGGYRLYTFWWQQDLHEAVRPQDGTVATLTQAWRDADGDHTRTVSARVVGAQQIIVFKDSEGALQPVDRMDGTSVWALTLEVEADPDQVLSGCSYEVVDNRGRITTGSPHTIAFSLSADACVPASTPGPQYQMGELWGFDDEESAPRPQTYTVPLYIRLVSDAVPTELRISWEVPKYLALPVPAAAP